jgi:hypothetical protein
MPVFHQHARRKPARGLFAVIAADLAWAFCMIVVGIGSSARADDPRQASLDARGVAELPRALRRLEQRYAHVRFSGTLTEVRFAKASRPIAFADEEAAKQLGAVRPDNLALESAWSRNLILEASDGLKKTYQTVLYDKVFDPQKLTLLDRPNHALRPKRSVSCVGRNYAFAVRWEQDTPILDAFGTTNDQEILGRMSLSIWHHTFLMAPFTVFGAPLSEVMALPSFSVLKLSKSAANDGNLVINAEYRPSELKARGADQEKKVPAAKAGQPPRKMGRILPIWVEVAPADDWAVQAFGLGDRPRGKETSCTEITYGERRGGVSIPKSIANYQPLVGAITTFEIDAVEFKPIPESEFTLSAFGLPEREAPAPAKR